MLGKTRFQQGRDNIEGLHLFTLNALTGRANWLSIFKTKAALVSDPCFGGKIVGNASTR
jgi:hypothetical protein